MSKVRFLAVLAALAVGVLAWTSSAFAGYAIQPANGNSSGPKPTFLVYLDSGDSAAEVYVASTPDVSQSTGTPLAPVDSCIPSTRWIEPNKYTCQVFTTLKPGTYYWWMTFLKTEPENAYPTLHISGPFQFTVLAPSAPASTGPVTPTDGAKVSATPSLVVHAPANARVDTYVSSSPTQLSDGTPAGQVLHTCDVGTSTETDTTCFVDDGLLRLSPGSTYYWWAVIVVDGTRYTYPARSFVVEAPSPPPPPPPPAPKPGGGAKPHTLADAPYLPSSSHYIGRSVKQTRLSNAAYELSKMLGIPKSIAVACWSTADWQGISGINPDSVYTLLGFYTSRMPRWLELSPGICRSLETLLYHRPQFPNRITANAVDTLTHEMLHALGSRDEARTECFAMQLSWVTANSLGVSLHYSMRLSHLTWDNYYGHPPRYVNPKACREGGAWDLWPKRPSLPWHDFEV